MDEEKEVMYVDFFDGGYREQSWPMGFYLHHGMKGVIAKIERGWPVVMFSDGDMLKGCPDRPMISFNINWFRRIRQAEGYRVPPEAFHDDRYNPRILVGVNSRHHILMLSDKEEVKRVDEVRQKVTEILQTMAWSDVIKYLPDGDERAFLLRNYGQSSGDMPPEMVETVRKIAAYRYLSYTYEKAQNVELTEKYGKQLHIQLLTFGRMADENGIVVDRTPTSTKPNQREERTTMAKGNAAVQEPNKKSAQKKAPAPVAKAAPVRKGKGFAQDDIRNAMKNTQAAENALIKMAKDVFGVTLQKGSLINAPNAGVMKMRAGNAIRSALKAAGLFLE